MRILLIEDDEAICEAVQAQLEKEGYTVDLCTNGLDAIYYVSHEAYDVVILDRLLPGMDGLSILQVMRKNKIRTPVIMATAMGSVSDRIDGLDCGADDYIIKPYDIRELSARIRALTRRPAEIGDTGQFTRNIYKECKRMGCLIDDMLMLASFDSGNWSVDFETLDTNVLMLDFYELYEPLCMDRKVPFQLHMKGDMLPEINGDRERIFQILSILMDNALSYNIDSRPISLEASADKSYVIISVTDHGQGIDDTKKELIFDRFYRADSARKDKKHFGLGLSIAKELLSLHRGTIQAEDTPGGGCTFVMRIPVFKSPSA